MHIELDTVPRHWTVQTSRNIELCIHCMVTRDKNTQKLEG